MKKHERECVAVYREILEPEGFVVTYVTKGHGAHPKVELLWRGNLWRLTLAGTPKNYGDEVVYCRQRAQGILAGRERPISGPLSALRA